MNSTLALAAAHISVYTIVNRVCTRIVKIMYEKYTGLPDTSKSASPSNGRAPSKGGSKVSAGSGHLDMYDAYSSPSKGGSSSRSAAPVRSSFSGGSKSSASRSSSSSSRAKNRKKKMRQRRFILFVVTVVILALLVLAISVLVKSCNEVEAPDPVTDAFRANVYINNLNVGGMTIDEARAQLAPSEEYTCNNVAITLASNEISAMITGPEMGATTNLEDVLTTAFNGGSNEIYYTAVSIDEGALLARLDELNTTLATAPTDASPNIDFDKDGKPVITFTEGAPGYGMDVESTKALIVQALADGSYQTSVSPQLATLAPAYTAEEAKAHLTLIGSYTTVYDTKGTAEDTQQQREVLIPNRAFNVEKGVKLINNQVVKPGRTWSFNNTVGDRNEKNGWKEANGIFGGDRFTMQYGGGICQVSTTLYNALMQCYPRISIVERRRHNIPSTYVDKGLDATVDTGRIDLRFKNISEYPLYIFAYVETNKMHTQRKRNLIVLIYGEALPNGESYKLRSEVVEEVPPTDETTIYINDKKLFIGEEMVEVEARNSFTVDVYLEKYIDGKLVGSEKLYTDVYPGNPLKIRVGTLSTPTPEPSPTPKPPPMPDVQDMP